MKWLGFGAVAALVAATAAGFISSFLVVPASVLKASSDGPGQDGFVAGSVSVS